MTNTIKYSIAAFSIIVLLFLYNQSSQSTYDLKGNPIFEGQREEVFRVLITEDDKQIELVRQDTTWSLTQ